MLLSYYKLAVMPVATFVKAKEKELQQMHESDMDDYAQKAIASFGQRVGEEIDPVKLVSQFDQFDQSYMQEVGFHKKKAIYIKMPLQKRLDWWFTTFTKEPAVAHRND